MDIARAMEIKRRVEGTLLARPDVCAVGFGGKLRHGKPTGHFAIIVQVFKKRPLSEVAEDEVIPEEIDGVPTDVIEGRVPVPYMLEGGIELDFESAAAGMVTLEGGTLGCFAWRQDTTPPKAVLLSNDHVLYGGGRRNGDTVVLTSCSDCCKTVIAKLSATSGPKNALVDAAIADLEVTVNWLPRVHGVSIKGTLDLRPSSLPALHPAIRNAIGSYTLVVKKYGATTSLKTGVVANVAQSTVTRNSQLLIWPVYSDYFSKPGDSGSVIYVDNSTDNATAVIQQIFGESPVKSATKAKIVGLLWGGDPVDDDSIQKKTTVGSHIEDVCSLLSIKVATNAPAVIYQVGGTPRPHPAWARAHRDLSRAGRSAEIVALYGKHADEIRDLLKHCRRFVVAWHRNHGPTIVAALRDVAGSHIAFLPTDFEGQNWCDSVQSIADAVMEDGSETIKADLTHYLPLLTQLGGRSYEEVLGFLVLADRAPQPPSTSSLPPDDSTAP